MQIDDNIVFKFNGETLRYKVTECFNNFYLILLDGGGTNARIFEILGIDDRYGFCERIICKSLQKRTAIFPELDSLKELEEVVNALYQEIIDKSVPKYKEGDIVRILPRKGVKYDCPLGYVDDMDKYSNDLFSIKEVHELTVGQLKYYINCKIYEEPFYYILNGDPKVCKWSSKMFSKATEIATRVTVDTGEININGILDYIDTHTSAIAITCDKAVDGPSLYPEKLEEPEYKLNFSVKPLKF